MHRGPHVRAKGHRTLSTVANYTPPALRRTGPSVDRMWTGLPMSISELAVMWAWYLSSALVSEAGIPCLDGHADSWGWGWGWGCGEVCMGVAVKQSSHCTQAHTHTHTEHKCHTKNLGIKNNIIAFFFFFFYNSK